MGNRIILLAGSRRSLPALLLADAIASQQGRGIELVAVFGQAEYSLRRWKQWYLRLRGQLVDRILCEAGLSRGSPFSAERAQYLHRLEQSGKTWRSLPQFCRASGIPWHVSRDLNAKRTIDAIRNYRPDYAVASGAGILRPGLLAAFPKGILNLHCGPLPWVRGMNAVEWSLWLGYPPAVTLHLMDRGIDTGPILTSRPVPLQPGDTLALIRGRAVLTGIDLLHELLPELDELPRRPNDSNLGRQYYTMASSLRGLLDRRLAAGQLATGGRQGEPDQRLDRLAG